MSALQGIIIIIKTCQNFEFSFKNFCVFPHFTKYQQNHGKFSENTVNTVNSENSKFSGKKIKQTRVLDVYAVM